MQVTTSNDVRIYNLSAGKSLPDWLEERKRRALVKSDEGLRRRVQLLQEFDMPVVSNNVAITPDGRYIMATGTYKPRVKCYEVEQLGIKFERCFDADVTAFRILSDDYSKAIFLLCDRYIELHAQFGKYYRLRIPKFGRDLAYHPQTCEVYFVGDGSEVYRLNLEQGRFLNPLSLDAPGANACAINDDHHLTVVGSVTGTVEAWDPRSRQRVGILDTAEVVAAANAHSDAAGTIPQVTSVSFRDGLNLAVGTSTGHVLLYDIRSDRPLLVKDHMYGAPIKKVLFHATHDQVLSLDSKVLKIWDRATGKAYASIESESALNDVAVYPSSGLLFMTNEQPKMQVHYLPSLGPAPRWCAFLDSLTEELEESPVTEIYDDYKFVTVEQLQSLGLDHLIGTNLLRAYMHGFFMDIRLFRRAQSLADPYQVGNYMKNRISKELEDTRERRVQLNKDKLPKVNKDLFLKLKERESRGKARDSALLSDDRFGSLFSDDRFAIDPDDDAFRLLNPVLAKLDERKKKQIEKEFAPVEDDDDGDEEGNKSDIDYDDTSSEDDRETASKVKQQHKEIRREQKRNDGVKFYELKDSGTAFSANRKANGRSVGKTSLEKMLKSGDSTSSRRTDGHQMTFASKSKKKQEESTRQHLQERKAARRSTFGLKGKGSKKWM